MLRPLLAALLAAGLVFATSTAQDKKDEKKEPPKKKARVAVAEPKDAAADPDFAIQGEYVGKSSGEGGEKIGVQVVAKGAGTFAVKVHRGGLPGDGWNGKDVKIGTAERKDGKVVVTMKDAPPGVTVAIADGVFTQTSGDITATFKKVERTSKTVGAKPPEGAVVLFGEPDDVAKWDGGKLVTLSDGKFLGTGEKSKQKFGAFKAHVEFRLPWMPNSTGQGRGNSGVYPQDRYEIQVLDSFGLAGENNECGGIYTLHKPKVNMCLPPLVWQTYDIEFTPAQFDGDKKVKNARATVSHNGVTIHDDVELKGPTGGGQKEAPTPGPFQFQNHGDPVVYRNVWAVEVK